MRPRAVLGRVLLARGCVEAPGRLWAARASILLHWRRQRSLYSIGRLARGSACVLTYYLLLTVLLTYLLTYSTLPLAAQQAKQVDRWLDQYKSHANFKYIFHENARDVLNKQNPESVRGTLKYLATLC